MEEQNKENANEIYILLNKDYRISRHFRLKWYLDHLQKPVPDVCQNLNNVNCNDYGGLHIVSVSANLKTDNDCTAKSLVVGPETKVLYLSTAYRFVFGLDLSASMLRVDTLQHFVVIEAIIVALEKCLTSLVQPFSVNESFKLNPDIYVTVFVQWYQTQDHSIETIQTEKIFQKVLLQGCRLTPNTINKIVQVVKDCIYGCKTLTKQSILEMPLQKCDDIILGMLRTGLLALRALPTNRRSSVIIITGGIFGEPHAPSLERIIKQCQSTTTSCFFVHNCFSANPLCDFGCIPNIELMQFIAQSTNGSYINMLHVPTTSMLPLNFFQQALFPWTFQMQQPLSINPNILTYYTDQRSCSAFELRNSLPICVDSPSLIKQKQDDRNIYSDFVTVVSARLREGFKVRTTTINKNKIHMSLELQWWKNYTVVQYNVSSTWPLSSFSCKVEVFICGSYEFLHDVSKWQESKQWSRFRRQAVHRFLKFFKDLLQSDHMLQNLQGFTDDPVRYHISDSLRQGQTLFYMPPNSSQFELSTQSQDTHPAFSSYWKPILSLDANIWHRWLHIHRIEAILQHDMPLPSNLFNTSSNGRYHSIQCRVAFTTVASMLRKWCTFVLLENHTYVKLVYKDNVNNDIPISFFLARILCKSSAMVIKLAFLVGLSGKVRRQYVENLRNELTGLVFSVPTMQSPSSGNRIRHSSVKHSPVGKLSRSHYSTSDMPCAFILNKPLDQFLVRYSQAPENYLSSAYTKQIKFRSNDDMDDHHIRMRDMQWYLHHCRCVWSVSNTSTHLSIDLACHLANMLQNIRMKEGFHIMYASSGVINLTREFPMKTDDNSTKDYCLVQYIIFPPKIQSSESIHSSSSVESDEEEVDDDIAFQKEIIFATEMWVEPQYGSVSQEVFNISCDFSNNVPHYENLTCADFLSHIRSRDQTCIGNMVTLEHLHLVCNIDDEIVDYSIFPQSQHACITPSLESSPKFENQPKPQDSKSNISENLFTDKNFIYYSCLFDFVSLLENSSRVKHLYMTLAEYESNNHTANVKLVETFHRYLSSFCDCTVSLSQHDQNSITRHIFPKETKHQLETSQHLLLDWCYWKCYLKKGNDGQVFVIILPSSYLKFIKLLDISDDINCVGNIENKKVDLPIAIDENDTCISIKESRRMSFKRLASNTSDYPEPWTTPNVKQHTFYLYIYNCSRKMLESSLLHGALSSDKIKWADSLQDHRIPFYASDSEENVHVFTKRHDSSFQNTSSSFLELSDITENAFPLQSTENNYLSFITDSINKFYDHAFVVGIFCAVQSNKICFSPDDLQIATDYICKESVHEIDITDFMFLNCPQIIEFKNNNLKPSLPNSVKTQNDDIQSGNSDVEEVISFKLEKHFKKKKEPTSLAEISSESDNPVVIDANLKNSKSLNFQNSFLDSNISEDCVESNKGHFDLLNIFHKESAFSSVDPSHHTAPLVNQGQENNSGSASFDDEVCAITNVSSPELSKVVPIKPMLSTSTILNETESLPMPPKKVVPIKPLVPSNHQYSGLQTGWSNLPLFSIDSLNVAHSRHLSGSSDQVEKHFLYLLKAFCQSVPGVPFLFCSVHKSYPTKKSSEDNGSQFFENDFDVEFACDIENDNDSFSALPNETKLDPDSNIPLCKVENEFSINCSNSSDSSECVIPLFLYMTCTVRDIQSGNSGSVPVKCLPLSLKDVFDSFDKPCKAVDLSNIKITFDLIWIYLPCTEDETAVATVPVECSAFVQGVAKKVKWLLEDEIISSIRTTEPVNQITLDRVANHIKSRKTNNSKVATVPLQLIFGVDKSNSLLRSEFEKFRIDNYKLKKVDDYYFLSLERTFLPIMSGGVREDDVDSFLHEDHRFKLITSPISSQIKNEKNQPIQLKVFPFLCNQSSSASLLSSVNGVENNVNQSKLMKKASSSNELVLSSNNTVRRCTSASNMPLNTTVANFSQNKCDILSMKTSPPRYHPSLQPSLSLGKETKFFSPHGSNKGHVLSVPATPSSAANTASDIFIFPLCKPENKAFATVGDSCVSPTSECSVRQLSQTSWVGSGYEGEESDVGEELDFRNSLQEACNQLPNFWLLVRFDDANVNIYFHRRSSTKVLPFVKQEHLRIFELLSNNLKKSCKAVNQTLLLKMLHDTRLCHSLLVEESPEDIWKKDDYSSVYPHINSADDQTNDDSYRYSYSNDYLAATMDFPPGYFECKCVLEQTIILHHRIAVSKPNSGGNVATALSTVRSFMKNLTVINHKNMFVFQVEDGTVYYCLIHEEIKRPDSSGRKSSTLHDSDQSWSSREILVKQQENQSKLFIKWYGVHDPLLQHCEDLTKLKVGIEKKLNDNVVEYVTLMLCRNTQFKLTPADVCLIQPRVVNSCGHSYPQMPDHTVFILLPLKLSSSVTTFLYYVHQHLMQSFTIPRYTDSGSCQFLPFQSKNEKVRTAAPLDSPALYLYTELIEKGRKGHGIACVCLEFLQSLTKSFEKIELDKTISFDMLKECTSITTTNSSNNATEPAMAVHVWIKGSLNISTLQEKIQASIKHALCDAVTEHCLQLPFAPQLQVKTEAMKPLFNNRDDNSSYFYQNFIHAKLGVSNAPNVEVSCPEKHNDKGIEGGALLNKFFSSVLQQWLLYKISIGSPSVICKSIECSKKINVYQIVNNIYKIVGSVLSDSNVLKFCKIGNSADLYSYIIDGDLRQTSPGDSVEFILLSRNFDLWNRAVNKSSAFKISSVTNSLQKFPPHDVNLKPDASPCPQHVMMMSSAFIPRQHILLLLLSNNAVTIFTYNIINDKVHALINRVEECIKFHQARLNMLQGLTMQKLGLFKHFTLKLPSSTNASVGPYSIDSLTKHCKVPNLDKKLQRFTVIDKCFDEILLNVPRYGNPALLLETQDLTTLYGHQCFSWCRQKKALKEGQIQLKTLWRKASGSSLAVSSDSLKTVLSYARLMYSVTSPILLDKATRLSFLSLFDFNQKNEKPVGILRTSSFLTNYRRKSGDSMHKMIDGDKSNPQLKDESADFYLHSLNFISSKFIELYDDHWKSFVELHIGDQNQSSEKKQPGLIKDYVVHYRYRSLREGIILIEYFASHNCLQVKLYSISASHFFDHVTRNHLRTHTSFTNDCEKIKQNLDLHSVSLDVHLRYLQWYLKNSSYFNKFNLYELLLSVHNCYGTLLENIQSQLYQSILNITCTQVNSHDLFEFIINNATALKLRTCSMLNENTDVNENILFTDENINLYVNKCTAKAHTNCCVFLIIFKIDDSESNVLRLNYYLLFSHFREQISISTSFNKRLPDALAQAGVNISRRLSEATGQSVFSTGPPQTILKQHCSDLDDIPVPSFVNCEKTCVENSLREVVSIATAECYRSRHLWKKLSNICQEKASIKCLNYSEFCTLVEMMQSTSITEYDQKLGKLLLKRNSLKQDLFVQKRLLKKFPKISTLISSPDGSVQHICILSTEDVHVMLMMTTKSNTPSVDVAVVRPLTEHIVFHKDSSENACLELISKVYQTLTTSIWMSWM